MRGQLFWRDGGLSCSAILKIALVILHANPDRGGAERYTVDLAGGLHARGHDVAVIASSFAGAPRRGDVLLATRRPTRIGRYNDFISKLEALLAGTRYDIVHAMLPAPRCDVYHPHAGIAAEAIRTGHLKHESPVKRAFAKAAGRFNRRRQRFAEIEGRLLASDKPPIVLCLSYYIKGVVRRHYDLPDAGLATLFNAVDLARFDPATRSDAGQEVRRRLGIGPERVVALMIAQDFARKGLREAILALAKVNDPRLALVVVGKQGAEAYRQLAAREGVGDRVIFAGATTDPYSYYRAADFFVLPTRHDPCSLVVLEALAMGLPVISTIFNGAREIMTEGRHGFVLKDPADVIALAGSMRRLLDAGDRGEMSRACLELRAVLSFETHLDRLEDIYRRAVETP